MSVRAAVIGSGGRRSSSRRHVDGLCWRCCGCCVLEALPFGVRIAIAAGQAGMTKLFGFAGRDVDLRVLPPPLLVVVLSAGYRYQHGAGIRLLRAEE